MKPPGAHRGRRIRAALGGILLLTTAAAPLGTPCQADSPDPYAVKAAFLYNIARFVEWPPDSIESQPDGGPAPFRFCVVGEDPFGPLLDELAHSQRLQGRPIEIRRCKHADGLDDCEMVFVGLPEDEWTEALAAAEHQGALTVGEGKAFVRAGGAIGLMVDHNRVRFEVNLAAAERAGLRISSKLLRLALLVGEWPLAKEAP